MKKDFLYYLPTLMISSLVGFISIKVYTSYFSTNTYGLYSTATSIIGIAAFVFRGINGFFFRFYSEKKKKGYIAFFNTITSLIFFLILLLLTFIIIYGSLKYNKHDTIFIKLIAFGFLSQAINYIFGFLQSIHRIKREINKYSVFTILNQLMSFSIGLVFIFILNFDIYYIFISTAISSLIILIFLLKDLKKDLPRFKIKIDMAVLKQYYKYGIPMSIAAFASIMLNLSDRLVIHYFLDSTQVALYDVPARITEKSILLVLMLFEQVDRPFIMQKIATHNKATIINDIYSFVKLFLLIIIPVITIYFTFSTELINLISDEKYMKASSVVPVIALSYLFIGLGSRIQIGTLIAKKTSSFLKISIICGLVNLIGNIIYIPIYGYKVAAYTTLISSFIYFTAHIYYSKKYYLNKINLKLFAIFSIIAVLLIVCSKTAWIFLKSTQINLFCSYLIMGGGLVLFYIILLIVFNEIKSFNKLKTIFQKSSNNF